MPGRVVLKMENITKRFPGVLALNNVSFELLEGEVHVLLGENGAGKSTLMKILSGAYQRDEGSIVLDGESIEIRDPKSAIEMGIGTIYQEFNLNPFFNIAENIFLGREFHNGAGLIDWKKMHSEARKAVEMVGLEKSTWSKVKDMSVAKKQLVEIAKALSLKSKIIIFDEPTATLSEKDVDHLFKLIESLKSEGKSIVYISHRMEEIKAIGDRCTVLRDGNFIATVDLKSTPREELIKMVAGRTIDMGKKSLVTPGEDIVLEVRNLRAEEKAKDVSFKLRRGEILGFAGLVGSGRTETMKSIVGAIKRLDGNVFLEGEEVNFNAPWDALGKGLVYLSEDRKDEGLVLKMNVRHNITLSSLKSVCKGKLLRDKLEKNLACKYIEELRVKCPSDKALSENLSGGNQQKVIIGRALACSAKVFIFDEPTRGIDVGAKEEIYSILQSLAREGYGIIMISSELPEILRISNRVVVMREGKVSATLENDNNLSQDMVLNFALGE